MKRAYRTKNFNAEHSLIIHHADIIIQDYAKQGFTLTLRQLYYQFVSKNLIANRQSEYDRLGDIISEARICGLIDWEAIEDRTRGLRGLQYFDAPAQAVERVLDGYQLDKWRGQAYRPEVWIEKDALIGVIEPICNELGVDYFGCRGYNSQSEQWRAGRRFASYYQKGQTPIVFHLGDHDPSGLDMTRDNRERLELFCGSPVTVVRLALNMDQVQEFDLPPNPVKKSDKRWQRYVDDTGTESSWELDALEPSYISKLISDAVLKVRNEEQWNEELLREVEDREHLQDVIRGLKESDEDE
jgi:hypothetical protein